MEGVKVKTAQVLDFTSDKGVMKMEIPEEWVEEEIGKVEIETW